MVEKKSKSGVTVSLLAGLMTTAKGNSREEKMEDALGKVGKIVGIYDFKGSTYVASE